MVQSEKEEVFRAEFAGALQRHLESGAIQSDQELIEHFTMPEFDEKASIDDPTVLAYVTDLQRLRALYAALQQEDGTPEDRSGIIPPGPADASYEEEDVPVEPQEAPEIEEETPAEVFELLNRFPEHLDKLVKALGEVPLGKMALGKPWEVNYTPLAQSPTTKENQTRIAMLIGALMEASGLLSVQVSPHLVDYSTGKSHPAVSDIEKLAVVREILRRQGMWW